MTPAQALEATEIPIRRDPLAARLDREGREIGVRDEIPTRSRLAAEAAEDRPMTVARSHQHTVRLTSDLIRECQGIFERTGICKDLRVSHDPHETAEDQFRHAIGKVIVEHLPQPTGTYRVMPGILAVRVDEDVDVGQNQRDDSMTSSNAAESSRSTPGRTPRPPTVLSFTALRLPLGRAGARVCRSASSTTAVKVRPVSAARRLAAAMSRSSRRMVVRICQNIICEHQYVNILPGPPARHFGPVSPRPPRPRPRGRRRPSSSLRPSPSPAAAPRARPA